jgi:hypothetical protein
MDKMVEIIIKELPLKMVKRKMKISIKEKLEGILMVLKTGISWYDLGLIRKYDESSYRKMFYKISKLGIIKKIIKKIRHETKISYIDSTIIVNKCGLKETIGYCPQNKKHKGNKISLIVNEKGKPLNCIIDKSSCHDLNMFEGTIEDIKTEEIIGDKGYTSRLLKEKMKNKKIKLLIPYKKNSKQKNNAEEKKKLKKRHIVENSICNLKKLRRLGYRYEKKIEYFICFVELGLLYMIIR